MAPRAWLCGWLAAAACGGAAIAAPAEIRVSVGGVTGGAVCPDPAAVARALSVSLPSARVVLDGDGAGPAARVVIRDEGRRYRVRAGAAERVISDPRRRCDERAHAAAVFATLALAPPRAGEDEARAGEDEARAGEDEGPATAPASPGTGPGRAAEPTPEAAAISTTPARGSPATGRLRPLRVELEGSVRGDFAPALADRSTVLGDLGGALRLVVRGGVLGGSLGANASALTSGPAGDGAFEMVRGLFDLSLRAGDALDARRRFELFGELGLALGWHHVKGQGFDVNLEAWGFDVGLRFGVAGRWRFARRLALFLGLDGVALFFPHDLLFDGVAVSITPSLWIGGALGLAVELR